MKLSTWICVLALAIVVQLTLEALGVLDSIGWWYTLYSAGISTVILAAFVLLVRMLRRMRQRP